MVILTERAYEAEKQKAYTKPCKRRIKSLTLCVNDGSAADGYLGSCRIEPLSDSGLSKQLTADDFGIDALQRHGAVDLLGSNVTLQTDNFSAIGSALDQFGNLADAKSFVESQNVSE